MIRCAAVGFDLDGTLFDHRGAAVDAVDTLVREFDQSPSDEFRQLWFAAEDDHFERWRAGLISFQEQRRNRVRVFLSAIGVAVPPRTVELDRLFDCYLSAYRAAWRPYPDVIDLLRALRRDGIAVGVLTNGNHEQQIDKLAVIGIDQLVNVVCTSERIGYQKPDPRAFETLAHDLGVHPSDVVFVGDNPEHDVAGARAAGMRAGLVDRSGSARVELITALDVAR